MTIVRPTQDQLDLYGRFIHYLNAHNGHLDALDAIYFDFLDKISS